MKGYLSIFELQEMFPDDNVCLDYIFHEKYGKVHQCQNGKVGTYRRVKGRQCYQCSRCRMQTYPLRGTELENTKIPIRKWIYAFYEFNTCKNGESAHELSRRIGLEYKDAWHMAETIRKMMREDTSEPLTGVVEVDEAGVGGKYDKRRKRYHAPNNRRTVVGGIQRDGNLRMEHISDRSKAEVVGFIKRNVEQGTTIYTDDHSMYTNLEKEEGYKHDSVNHSDGEYVRDDVTTNRIENGWLRFKGNIRGTYVSVSPRHTQSYLDEFCFRFNRRNVPDKVFYDLLAMLLRRPPSG